MLPPLAISAAAALQACRSVTSSFTADALPPACRNQADGLVRALEVGIEHDDPGAFPGVGLAYALPDARSAAGHGGDVSLEKAGHSFPPDFKRKKTSPRAEGKA